MPVHDPPPLVAEARQNEVNLLRAFNRMAEAVRIGIDVGTRRDRDMHAFREARNMFEEAVEEFRRALGVNLSLMSRLAEENETLKRRLDWYEPEESTRPILFSNIRHAMAVLRGR